MRSFEHVLLRGHPRADYMSRLAWQCISDPLEELKELAGDREVPRNLDPDKGQNMDGWILKWLKEGDYLICIYHKAPICSNSVTLSILCVTVYYYISIFSSITNGTSLIDF